MQWDRLISHIEKLCSPTVVDRLNRLVVDVLQNVNADEHTLQFVQTFVSRYVTQGRPLSGYFIVCCVIETEWTVLAQALARPSLTYSGTITEAAAANKAWLSLMRQATQEVDISDQTVENTLKSTIKYSMQCFTDLFLQIEEMDAEPSLDTYAWETMSESLVSRVIHTAMQDLSILFRNWPLSALSRFANWTKNFFLGCYCS